MNPRCWNDKAIARAKALRTAYDRDAAAARAEVIKESEIYSFYHNIEIIPGVVPAGYTDIDLHIQPIFKVCEQVDFKNKRVLDVGCRDGAVAFYAEDKGASEVYALDNDFSAALTNFLIPFKNSSIKTIECNLNELDRQELGQFDIIFLCGVLYHLSTPFWGLRQVRDALRPEGCLIIETALIDAFEDFPMMACLTNEKSPYEPGSPTFFNLAGLRDAAALLGLESCGASVRWGSHFFDAQKNCPEFAKKSGISQIDTYRYTGLYRRKRVANTHLIGYFEDLHDLHNKSTNLPKVTSAV